MSQKSLAVLTLALALAGGAAAQNIAIVNGKAVPKARADLLLQQASRGKQSPPITPELEKRAADEAVMREIFAQEAEQQGIPGTQEYQNQMELARQTVLIRELFASYQKKNAVSEAEAQAEYDKFKAQASGTEYRARHILVDKESQAKALLAQLKAGAKFETLARKNSKDSGSGAKGGDLDYAKPDAYVPEFSQAMVKLKKGEITAAPVKSQFGWHLIKLEDTRQAQFPPFAEVKTQIEQSLMQQKLQQFQDDLRTKAKTDYKFEQ